MPIHPPEIWFFVRGLPMILPFKKHAYAFVIPVSPMDGGRVAGGISRWLLIVGILLGVWIFWQLGSPLLLLMLILGGLQTWRSFKDPVPGYYEIPVPTRVLIGVSYIALLGALFAGYSYASLFLKGLSNMQTAAIEVSAALASFFPLPSSKPRGAADRHEYGRGGKTSSSYFADSTGLESSDQ